MERLYGTTVRKYEQDSERFESVKQKLKLRAKNYKMQFEKENSALVNKSSLLEEETQLLKLHVNKVLLPIATSLVISNSLTPPPPPQTSC